MRRRFWITLQVCLLALGCGRDTKDAAPPPGPPQPVRPDTPARSMDVGTTNDYGLVAASTFSAAGPGQGRESMNGQARDFCLAAPTIAEPPTSPRLLRFARPLSREEEEAVLGAPVGSYERFERGWPSMAGTDENDPRGLTLLYAAEWRARHERLDRSALTWRIDPTSPEFPTRCGDLAVVGVEKGGRLLVRWELRFASEAVRAQFEALAGPSPAAWEVAPILAANPHLFAGAVHSGIQILQSGGQASLLTRLGAALGTEQQLACLFGAAAGCAAIAEVAADLAAAEGPGSLQEEILANPGDLGYDLASWQELGAPRPPRAIPEAVRATRLQLQALLTEQLQVRDRLDTLALFGTPLPAALQARVAEEKVGSLDLLVDQNLNALRTTARECFWITGPEDEAGVERCVRSPERLAARGYRAWLTLAALP